MKILGNFLKKCQVFGNFLTVKLQFSGGSDVSHAGLPPRESTSCHAVLYRIDIGLTAVPNTRLRQQSREPRGH